MNNVVIKNNILILLKKYFNGVSKKKINIILRKSEYFSYNQLNLVWNELIEKHKVISPKRDIVQLQSTTIYNFKSKIHWYLENNQGINLGIILSKFFGYDQTAPIHKVEIISNNWKSHHPKILDNNTIIIKTYPVTITYKNKFIIQIIEILKEYKIKDIKIAKKILLKYLIKYYNDKNNPQITKSLVKKTTSKTGNKKIVRELFDELFKII